MAKKKKGSERLAVQNACKTLLANIRFASVDNPIHTIAVTSSVPNEGKSTVALHLAQAIATSGASVLLVESDMRRRSLAGMLGVHPSSGIYAVLSEQVSIEEAVVETNQENLFFLDAEPHIPNPADIIASRRFSKMVNKLEDRFRYVVFDTPPVGTFIDAAEVGSLADGVVFVIRENYTKRHDVVNAVEQLRKAECNILGSVMNCCESDRSEYYYAYYNANGERVGGDVPAPAPGAPIAAANVGGAAASRTAMDSSLSTGTRFARR